MQRPGLIFENSPFFLILCLLAGALYATLLYRKRGPWSPLANKLLFFLRTATVALIAALLLSPVLKQVHNIIERPALIFAIDNSASIAEVMDSTKLRELNNKLRRIATETGDRYAIEYRNLSGEKSVGFPKDIRYDARSTDLHSLINDIKVDYEGRNLSAVVLVSDGIYNQGISPTFSDYSFDVYTVGVGDTVPKADLSIISLLYNRISYQGNKFPVIASISHRGYPGEKVKVSVVKNDKLIATQEVTLGKNNEVTDVKFIIEAKEKGYQRYEVAIERKEGEFTFMNNVQQAYIEIVEGKEQIAIIAPAPHPDIKAIKAAVESNANYNVDQFVLSLNRDARKLTALAKKYDLIIYHQFPDSRGVASRFLDKFQQKETSSLIIYGSQTDIKQFNEFNKVLSLDALPGEYDKVSATFNQGFTSFKLSDELQQAMDEFPPLSVPFGEVPLREGADVLLYQQVGSIATNKPLIAFRSPADVKNGVIMGEGIWLWKLADYARNGNNEAFNELITKIVQYLSSKEDKRKFKVYPVKNEFLTNEKVIFNAEVYNDLYERVFGHKIDLTLTDAAGKRLNYSYVTNERNTRYSISGLPEGVYQYAASTTLEGKKETVRGEFLIKELQVENLNLTANFNLLRNISKNTGSHFYHTDQLDRLKNELAAREARGTIHTGEKYLPFIYLKWLFFLLLGLISAEWFIRKYSGAY